MFWEVLRRRPQEVFRFSAPVLEPICWDLGFAVPSLLTPSPSSTEALNCGGREGTPIQLIYSACPQGFSTTSLWIHKSFTNWSISSSICEVGREVREDGSEDSLLSSGQWAEAVPTTPSKSQFIFRISWGQLVIQRPQSPWQGTERGFCFPQKGKLRFLW